MKIERSETQIEAAERFGKKAAELSDTEPREGITALAKNGLVKLVAQDDGWSLVAPALQSVAYVNPSLGLASAMNLLAADMLRRWGGDKSAKMVERIETGDAIATPVVPARASEAPQLISKTDQMSLDGAVGRVCNAPITDVFAVLAARDDGICLSALGKDHKDLSVGEKINTIGMAGVQVAPVAFKDATVSNENIVGPDILPDSEPDALKARWSLCIAAILCGSLSAALDEVKTFANEHTVGDKPVAKFQAQRFYIADMFASLDTANLMLDRAAYAIDSNDREAKVLCDCARLLIDEVVDEISTKGLKVFGASGTQVGVKFRKFIDDAKMARFVGEHPDSLLSSVYETVAEQF